MRTKLIVLHEDNHLLVVDKPAGLATAGVPAGEESLVTMAKQYLKAKHAKPGNVYLGVVSRLDAWVSGVVVLARTSKAAARLSEQFRSGGAAKRYWAIVDGDLPEEAGELVDHLAKDDAARRIRVVALGGQRAELRFRVLGRRPGASFLEIELLTGRKHQIRAQLSAAGWPIRGDRKYGSRQVFLRGIALHSAGLRLRHPTERDLRTFVAAPPRGWPLDSFRVEFAGHDFRW
jgi:23S rRNA pseudouridine1911/1915/1917 synthase